MALSSPIQPSVATTPDGLESLGRPLLDLDLTLQSGQVFHWEAHGAGFAGLVGRVALYLEQRSGELLVTRGRAALARRYLALDHPLDAILAGFPDDPTLREASAACAGMRILRQPLWECLATFITSSMKQVAHIRAMSLAIRERFGVPVRAFGRTFHAYPDADAVAGAGERALRECGLGFRAPNLVRTAATVAAGEADLEGWRALPTGELRERLCGLPGVGVKVANCVLLFAYERLDCIPVDVWIERILRSVYLRGKRKVTAARMARFAAEYFGPYGGYAQQYLFHHARMTWKRGDRR